MRSLLVRPQAQLDITVAAGWYEDQKPDLGYRFLDAVDHLLSRIQRSPLQFPEIERKVRRGLLQRFPYSVYFSVTEDRIEVIAVLHQHRHPVIWKSR